MRREFGLRRRAQWSASMLLVTFAGPSWCQSALSSMMAPPSGASAGIHIYGITTYGGYTSSTLPPQLLGPGALNEAYITGEGHAGGSISAGWGHVRGETSFLLNYSGAYNAFSE